MLSLQVKQYFLEFIFNETKNNIAYSIRIVNLASFSGFNLLIYLIHFASYGFFFLLFNVRSQ